MKKYISIIAALFAVILSSCSNDDIPTEFSTQIRVNPATIMSNFTYQCNTGDLDGVDAGKAVRLRLYVFDQAGKLVEKQEELVANYLSTATFELNIPEGSQYQAVAICDVITKRNQTEYWSVSDENSISSMKITYVGSHASYGAHDILGVKSVKISSGQSTTIDVEAAGALVCTVITNIHVYENIESILIFGNRGNGYYTFNDYGSLNVNPELDENSVLLGLSDLPSHTANGIYSYKFFMPQKNMQIMYGMMDYDGTVAAVSAVEGLTLEMGKEYLCYLTLDPNNNGSGEYSYGVSPINSGRSFEFEMSSPVSQETCEFNPGDDQYFIKNLLKLQSEK